MIKYVRRIGVCVLIVTFVLIWMYIAGRELKQWFPDSVAESFVREMGNLIDPACAEEYLEQYLPKLEAAATRFFREVDFREVSGILTAAEEFAVRAEGPGSLTDSLESFDVDGIRRFLLDMLERLENLIRRV